MDVRGNRNIGENKSTLAHDAAQQSTSGPTVSNNTLRIVNNTQWYGLRNSFQTLEKHGWRCIFSYHECRLDFNSNYTLICTFSFSMTFELCSCVCCLDFCSIIRAAPLDRLVGLGVWFSLRVREVPGSIPGRARWWILFVGNRLLFFKHVILCWSGGLVPIFFSLNNFWNI